MFHCYEILHFLYFVLLQAEVRPQCGRVVGFGAGKENPHGVRAVTKGQRCAVALWFTLDPVHEEKVWVMFLQELIFMYKIRKA